MDQHEEATKPPIMRLDNLHKGALKVISRDKLVLRKSESITTPRALQKHGSTLSMQSLPDRVTVEREDSDPGIYTIPLKEFWSEPRSTSRRRCTDEMEPDRLFEDGNSDLLAKEAFALRPELRRRKAKREPFMERDFVPLAAPRRREGPQPYQTRPRSTWLIPAEHPFKVLWDICTVIISVAHAHAMHVSIRDRRWGASPFMIFCDVWFLVDILLNFVTERKTAEGEILRDYRSICARYLTSWFAVDALSVFPWETLYVKPIIDIQNRRGFFRRSFFRSRAVVRVTRHLRGKHFRWFGRVARKSKQHGIGASRLLRLIIKYVPKYVLFFRNMKGIVAFRVLRQFQWFRRFYTNLRVDEKGDNMTGSLTRDDIEDDLSSNVSLGNSPKVKVVYEDWELMDDGVPL